MGLCLAIIIGALTSEAFAQSEWERYEGNPMLDKGPNGEWDGFSVYGPSVLFDKNDPDPAHRYKMWYSGSDDGFLPSKRIGYATSSDGILWEKHPANPVLNMGPRSWDDARVGCPTVILDTTDPDPARRYKMWYHGYDGLHWRIGYATSPDGIVWAKHSANPVINLGSGGAWDDFHVFSPTVILDSTDPGHRYKMWYSGDDGYNGKNRIGYATSPDGIVWIKHPGNPVLDLGPSGAWDSAYAQDAAVLFNGEEYEMWYCGTTEHGPGNNRIGYATSPDGIVWIKHPGNPVLDLGPGGAWDDLHVFEPSILLDGTDYRMWYSGYDGSHYRIGYATAPMDIIPVEIDIKPGSFPNAINLRSKGVIPVAILTTSIADGDPINFDVTEVDQSSLTLAEAAARVRGKSGKIGSFEDVDGDTDLDLVVHFPTSELELTEQDTEAVLEGQTIDGTPIQGSDTIMLVPRAAAAKFPEFTLHQNFPNFFNPDTWIPYQLAEDVKVTITIYDASGKLVRTLDLGHKTPGFYMTKDKAAYWDGKNETGEQAASGVYFYTIQAGEFTATKKMVIAE